MRRHLCLLVASTLLLAGCSTSAGLMQDDTRVVQIAATKRAAPITISGISLDGQRISSKSLDGIVVVNAWASWCRTCILEWRDLQEVARDNPDVEFLGLNESDSKQAALKFLTTHPTNYEHIFDPDNAILNKIKDLQSLSIPTTLILDKQHRIAARILGQVYRGKLQEILSNLRAE